MTNSSTHIHWNSTARQSILPRTRIFLPVVCVVTAAIGCGRSKPPAVVASPEQADEVSATADPNPFFAVAKKIENSHNRYLGRQQIKETQRKLDQANDHQERVNLAATLLAPSASGQHGASRFRHQAGVRGSSIGRRACPCADAQTSRPRSHARSRASKLHRETQQ